MRTLYLFFACVALAVTMTGCGVATIKPNYSSTNPDLLRIGGEKPVDREPEIMTMGSYCLQVLDKWKADGKTPDAQTIWSKDTSRKAVPCR